MANMCLEVVRLKLHSGERQQHTQMLLISILFDKYDISDILVHELLSTREVTETFIKRCFGLTRAYQIQTTYSLGRDGIANEAPGMDSYCGCPALLLT
jgi:hypothetical protein